MNPLPATLATTLAVFAPAPATAADATPEARLHDAAGRGDARAIGELLRAGARLDTRDEAQRTPLLVATRLNHVDAARVLIEAGADVELADGDGVTPRQHAHRRGHAAIERLLAHAGAQ